MNVTHPATAKQLAFLQRIAAERHYALPVAVAELSIPEASQLIDRILAIPRTAPVHATRPTLEPGMYLLPDGRVFKVQKAKDSDRIYAKRLQPIGGRRLTETDDVVRFEFVYERGAIAQLQPEHRMSLAEAKAFGIRYGVCCWCGARLSDAKSVANGIGPICATRI